jgi:hypothetical protein
MVYYIIYSYTSLCENRKNKNRENKMVTFFNNENINNEKKEIIFVSGYTFII